MAFRILDARRTLVIPDVHNQIDVADKILAAYSDIDQRVFLGDYFDSKGGEPADTPVNALRTAKWLKTMLQFDGNVMILGNHDAPYRWGGFGPLLNSKWHPQKQEQIDRILDRGDWSRVLLTVQVAGWTLSHAGWGRRDNIGDGIKTVCNRAIENLDRGIMDSLFRVGRARGGLVAAGGIIWKDWDGEFEAYPGMKQVVGHTRSDVVRQDGENYCIDTGLKHYAIIEPDGSIQICETQLLG